MPFDVANFEKTRTRAALVIGWRPPARQGEAHSDFIRPLTAPPFDSLPFDRLPALLAAPVRAFFQQRLRVNFRAEGTIFQTTSRSLLRG
ncbi:hypothetical protein MJ561_23735 [Klebsiella pneumoniae]|nr:hypothetical protein MJ561_23735 [Klebsiella pneumoniae]